jgi:hypothetical protein
MDDQSVKTLSVPEAGRVYFGLGRNASYAAATRGEIPTIWIGGRRRAPVVLLERMLEQADQLRPGPTLSDARSCAGADAAQRVDPSDHRRMSPTREDQGLGPLLPSRSSRSRGKIGALNPRFR